MGEDLVERATGIEPVSEAWEAVEATETPKEFAHFLSNQCSDVLPTSTETDRFSPRKREISYSASDDADAF
jgi:hypothetical protein